MTDGRARLAGGAIRGPPDAPAGGRPRVAFGFTITHGNIVEIEVERITGEVPVVAAGRGRLPAATVARTACHGPLRGPPRRRAHGARSERLGFPLAYALASVAVIGMVAGHSLVMLHHGSRALVVGSGVTLLYVHLYILHMNEDYALLIGSVGLFVIVAVDRDDPGHDMRLALAVAR